MGILYQQTNARVTPLLLGPFDRFDIRQPGSGFRGQWFHIPKDKQHRAEMTELGQEKCDGASQCFQIQYDRVTPARPFSLQIGPRDRNAQHDRIMIVGKLLRFLLNASENPVDEYGSVIFSGIHPFIESQASQG